MDYENLRSNCRDLLSNLKKIQSALFHPSRSVLLLYKNRNWTECNFVALDSGGTESEPGGAEHGESGGGVGEGGGEFRGEVQGGICTVNQTHHREKTADGGDRTPQEGQVGHSFFSYFF